MKLEKRDCPIKITLSPSGSSYLGVDFDFYGETYKTFHLNFKDLCYAVAKACTEILKEYGFFGYRYSTEYDWFKIYQLLFIKAYALDNMESRKLIATDSYKQCFKTDFEKEMELLLFDM